MIYSLRGICARDFFRQILCATRRQEMSSVTPYLALGIFPLAFLLAFSFNPPALRWVIGLALQDRPFVPVSKSPPVVRKKAAAFKRYAYFLGDGIIVGLVAVLMARSSLPAARVGLHLDNWGRNAAIGFVTATLRVVAQRLILVRVPIDPEDSFTWDVRRGPLALWMSIYVAGAFSEELWVALCIVSLMGAGHTATASVAMILTVFAGLHCGYVFWGALGAAVWELGSALLFLHYRSLIPPFLFHFIGNLGTFYWHRCWRR